MRTNAEPRQLTGARWLVVRRRVALRRFDSAVPKTMLRAQHSQTSNAYGPFGQDILRVSLISLPKITCPCVEPTLER